MAAPKGPRRRWTREEDDFVLSSDLPRREVAARLGRSEQAVKERRAVLRHRERRHKPKTLARWGHHDWVIAKTCPGCGVFLPAEEFRRGRGIDERLRDVCWRCHLARMEEHRLQDWEETRPAADHHGDLWTGEQLEILLRVDERGRWALSTRDAAFATGRTAGAVKQARVGYRKQRRVELQPPRVTSFGVYGVLDMDREGLLCHECGRRWRHLARHALGAHGLTADEYRARSGLGTSVRLVAPGVTSGVARELTAEQVAALGDINDAPTWTARLRALMATSGATVASASRAVGMRPSSITARLQRYR